MWTGRRGWTLDSEIYELWLKFMGVGGGAGDTFQSAHIAEGASSRGYVARLPDSEGFVMRTRTGRVATHVKPMRASRIWVYEGMMTDQRDFREADPDQDNRTFLVITNLNWKILGWLRAVSNFIWNILSGKPELWCRNSWMSYSLIQLCLMRKLCSWEMELRRKLSLYSWELKSQVYMHIHLVPTPSEAAHEKRTKTRCA